MKIDTHAGEKIVRALLLLEDVLDEYQNSGDWYGCIKVAVPYLKESLRSCPPGFMGREDWEKQLRLSP